MNPDRLSVIPIIFLGECYPSLICISLAKLHFKPEELAIESLSSP